LIPDQLSLVIQKNKEFGMLSLDQFQYSAYNNDFGPLTIGDLF